MNKVKNKWLRWTEQRNALDYLRQAHYYIGQTETNIMAWKWVVICLHGALYGFAICATKGTYTGNVTYKTRNGIQKLIGFNEALKRCQDQSCMRFVGNNVTLQLTESQRKSILQLKKEFRDSFEHYIPQGWSIEIHGFPELAIDVLEVIRFLAIETGYYVHLKKSEKKEIKSIVFQSKKALTHCELFKENQR